MNSRAVGKVVVSNWDEKTWDGKGWNEQQAPKLTHAIVTATVTGDIEGEGPLHFLMSYHEDQSVRFIGLQQVVGRIGGRTGSFVIEIAGNFENGAPHSTWTIVPGSGTGQLTGLRGQGSSMPRDGEMEMPYTLDYSFENASEAKSAQ